MHSKAAGVHNITTLFTHNGWCCEAHTSSTALKPCLMTMATRQVQPQAEHHTPPASMLGVTLCNATGVWSPTPNTAYIDPQDKYGKRNAAPKLRTCQHLKSADIHSGIMLPVQHAQLPGCAEHAAHTAPQHSGQDDRLCEPSDTVHMLLRAPRSSAQQSGGIPYVAA